MTAWPRVAVIGGSLGGLTAALLLRDLGCEVEVFERSTVELQSRGAGIVVLDATSRYLRERGGVEIAAVTTSTGWLRYLAADGTTAYEEPRPYRYSAWHTIYGALLGCFDPHRYHLGREAVAFREVGRGIQLTLAGGGRTRCGLLVCADGIGSTARRILLPDVRPVYAGYVAWRGTVAEAELSPATQARLADAITYQVLPRSHILVYPIPSLEGSVAAGERLLNFVLYRNYAEGPAFDGVMTDRRGTRRETTVPPGEVSDAHVAELGALAGRHLAPQLAEVVQRTTQPFVQAIFDLEVPRMAFGRTCLIGDAAFSLRPHAAAGTAKAAADAWVLAEQLERTRGDIRPALAAWESSQLALGRSVLERSRRIGRRSQSEGTWLPGDLDLVFGLHEPGR